jgi:hypothetical protein
LFSGFTTLTFYSSTKTSICLGMSLVACLPFSFFNKNLIDYNFIHASYIPQTLGGSLFRNIYSFYLGDKSAQFKPTSFCVRFGRSSSVQRIVACMCRAPCYGAKSWRKSFLLPPRPYRAGQKLLPL